MPYKDKERQKQAIKEAVNKHRQGITSGITNEGITGQGITTIRPVIRTLSDPVKRDKLRKICQSLQDFRQLDNVYLGCGKDPIPMTEVSELPEVFPAEAYHQNYYSGHSGEGYCQVVIAPKLQKFMMNIEQLRRV